MTGASGFIGRALCERLLELGAVVHGTSRRDVELDADLWSHSCVDLTSADDVDRLVAEAKPDYVIHHWLIHKNTVKNYGTGMITLGYRVYRVIFKSTII